MEDNLNPDEKISVPASGHGLTRREWVQRMLAGAGAGIATPVLTEAQGAAAATPVGAQTEAGGEWKPAFLDDPQNQTLVPMAERIVPGSTVAQVNRFIDTALNAVTQESQKKFVAALNALEGESLHLFTKSFKDLSADQQDEILTAASTARPSNANLKPAGETASGAHPPVPGLRDYFDHLKDWVSMAYYSSEVGMKELGWTGENFFASLPGCEQIERSSF